MTKQLDDKTLLQAELFAAYREDPVFFVEHALGHFTWSKQREVLEAVRDHKYVMIHAAHGMSKTFVAAEIVTWFYNVFSDEENTKVVTSAPTYRQVEALLWKEIRQCFATPRIPLIGECQTVEIKNKKKDMPRHYAMGFSTDSGEKAEGIHAKNQLWIFDEAKGMEAFMFKAAFGALSDTGMQRFVLITTTDGLTPESPFYKEYKKDGLWHKIRLDGFTSPFVTGEQFQGLEVNPDNIYDFKRVYKDPVDTGAQLVDNGKIRENRNPSTGWGEGSYFWNTCILGLIELNGASNIIKNWQISRSFDDYEALDEYRRRNPGAPIPGNKVAGIDVAGQGKDKTVVYRRRGFFFDARPLVIGKEDHTERAYIKEMADMIEEYLDHDNGLGGYEIRIDATGIGDGLADRLIERGYNVIKFIFGAAAMDSNEYENVASELWLSCADVIQNFAIPEDTELHYQLIGRMELPPTQVPGRQKTRRRVESKKDYTKRTGASSPDKADAALLCMTPAVSTCVATDQY